MLKDRCETYRNHKAADDAYRAGDLVALREALGDPSDFPNCRQPLELAAGDHPSNTRSIGALWPLSRS